MKRLGKSVKGLCVILAVFTAIGYAQSMALAQCQDNLTITNAGSIYNINLNNTPNDIYSFGFDVIYQESELEYINYSTEGCPSWDFFMLNPKPCEAGVCTIRVGGFGVNPLLSGATECLVHLEFDVKGPSAEPCPQICLMNLVDDMGGWCNECNGADCSDCCCGPVVCDADADGIPDPEDNCPIHPNGELAGTCSKGTLVHALCTMPGENTDECGEKGFCSMDQEDSYPPGGNGCGDACECEGNLDGDEDCDGDDAFIFKPDFGRNMYVNPCTSINPCIPDFDCDDDVDGDDAFTFKQDFGRNYYVNPCPNCVKEPWCEQP